MAQFNLGELIKQGKVPNLGTTQNQEQIEYIALDLIDDDPRNFYELSGLDALAANIELLGLQQPIRVRSNPEDPGRVIIVSGHRRRAAIRKLAEESPEKWQKIPCIREQGEVSPALQELRLIYANSDTRKLSSTDLSKQAERVESLLYQLKEEGYELPGRMRDHVAEACKLSKTKLSNLKVIRENLEPKSWKIAWEKGKIVDSVALAIAKLPPEDQLRCWMRAKNKGKLEWYYESDAKRDGEALKAIRKLKCPEGGTCQHLDQKFESYCARPWNGCSGRCCGQCSDLGTCQFACPHFHEKIKQIKADKREQRKQEKLAKEERDRPEVEQITALWARFAEARITAGLTIEAYRKAAGIYADERMKKVWPEREAGRKITRDTGMPYYSGNGMALYEIQRLLKVADLLGCSLDYLFCRTDEPTPALQICSEPTETLPKCSEEHISMNWHPASEWPEDGTVAVVVLDWKEHRGLPDFDMTMGIYKGGQWLEFGCEYLEIDDVHKWLPIGDPATETPPDIGAVGQLVFSGWMPGGTNPAGPCDVVAVFDLGDGYGHKKSLAHWNGREFLFSKGGAKIEMPVVKWMVLPPDEEEES